MTFANLSAGLRGLYERTIADARLWRNESVSVLNAAERNVSAALLSLAAAAAADRDLLDSAYANMSSQMQTLYKMTVLDARVLHNDTLAEVDAAVRNVTALYSSVERGDYPALNGSSWGANFDLLGLQTYLGWHSRLDHGEFAVVPYANGASVAPTEPGAGAYFGGVFAPSSNRIFLVPRAQARQPTWHYIDCTAGTVVPYGSPLGLQGYMGGAYCPYNDRVYLVPEAQVNNGTWHYIEGASGTVVAYSSGVTGVPGIYIGGVYSPVNDRIYLVPFFQSNASVLHYIDCSSGHVVAYSHGVTGPLSYVGGAYSPTKKRIYMAPAPVGASVSWHYIDCETASLVEYSGLPISGSEDAYAGAVYSPLNDRIYFVPQSEATSATWIYVDCASGSLVSYSSGRAAGSPVRYAGGVYMPSSDRIYLMPASNADHNLWHYIDCAAGAVVAYRSEAQASVVAGAYNGGVYCPTNNRIYMAPAEQGSSITWHYIQGFGSSMIAPSLMASALFNKL